MHGWVVERDVVDWTKGQGSEGVAWMKDVAWSGGGLMQWMDDTLG